MLRDDLLSRITVDPQICHGKPCVRGLRYPVEFLLELLSSDMTKSKSWRIMPTWRRMISAPLARTGPG